MVTAIDSSVLLDVVVDDPRWRAASEEALRRAASQGRLVIGEIVLAEITPAVGPARMEEFLADWDLHFVASSRESSLLAGRLFANHLARGGKGGRIVPDFLVGAHAQLHADRLLARDRGYLRDCFKQLKVWQP